MGRLLDDLEATEKRIASRKVERERMQSMGLAELLRKVLSEIEPPQEMKPEIQPHPLREELARELSRVFRKRSELSPEELARLDPPEPPPAPAAKPVPEPERIALPQMPDWTATIERESGVAKRILMTSNDGRQLVMDVQRLSGNGPMSGITVTSPQGGKFDVSLQRDRDGLLSGLTMTQGTPDASRIN